MAVYEKPNQDDCLGLINAEHEFYSYLKHVFFRTKGALYAVLSVDNVYVSALRLEPYKDGMLLEALETRQKLRQQGYATKLLEYVKAKLTAGKYRKIYSHIKHDNKCSVSFHLKCGFLRISDHALMIDGSYLSEYGTYLLEV